MACYSISLNKKSRRDPVLKISPSPLFIVSTFQTTKFTLKKEGNVVFPCTGDFLTKMN